MSDGALTQEEIDALLFGENKKMFDRRKNWILHNVQRMEIGQDEYGSLLNLAAIINVIKIIKNYEGTK